MPNKLKFRTFKCQSVTVLVFCCFCHSGEQGIHLESISHSNSVISRGHEIVASILTDWIAVVQIEASRWMQCQNRLVQNQATILTQFPFVFIFNHWLLIVPVADLKLWSIFQVAALLRENSSGSKRMRQPNAATDVAIDGLMTACPNVVCIMVSNQCDDTSVATSWVTTVALITLNLLA